MNISTKLHWHTYVFCVAPRAKLWCDETRFMTVIPDTRDPKITVSGWTVQYVHLLPINEEKSSNSVLTFLTKVKYYTAGNNL